MKVLCIIPARYASTRLPGKPLRDIAGKPMIVRVYERAVQAQRVHEVVVATDDERIRAAVEEHGGHAVMTSADHATGTDRLAEVAAQRPDCDLIINVQGDEPLLPPALIGEVAAALAARPEAAVATLAAPFDAQHSPAAATTVKVVCDQGGLALYFSRAAIPYVRDADGVSGAFPYLRHIGIYAYRVAALKRYPQLAATPLEQAEKLEQLRFLEHGLRIAVGVVNEAPPPGVDCEEDLQRVEAFLRGTGAV